MVKTLIIVGTIYVGILAFFTLSTRTTEKDSASYFMAGSNLGSLLGLFTFAATLFSTFTLLGMPDFFRVHGVGAWIFLAVSDIVMVFGLLWIGHYLRKKTQGHQYLGMAGFMQRCFQSRLAGIVAFAGAFIFLIPYVAIQIRGVSFFLQQAFENSPPLWVYAICIVAIMLIYSEIGGLKAIIYSDVLQGIVLLVVIWIIGFLCLQEVGGIKEMFTQISEQNEALLSTPGPKGLFDFQFLFGSMVAICMIPFTQPQVSTRLIIMKDTRALFRTAIGLGSFAILVILPTVFLGMYGAIKYPDATTPEFLGNTLIHDQPGVLGAFVIIGLVAAAISTADSQIFSLGGETRSLLKGEDKEMVKIARLAIGLFALLALGFAILSSDELVLLARASFAGTSLLAPMIFTGIFYDNSAKIRLLPILTLIAIVTLVCANLGLISTSLGGIRLDLILLGALSIYAVVAIQVDKLSS
ncbi:MAG: sodium:solute symporter family protein [Saprospiraceae bacterium]|nr:sodium:solute symporter family protein [Saprospiraceae bacterium]